jgi:photosystem II stability/assembly factor-like uncharacterized protein
MRKPNGFWLVSALLLASIPRSGVLAAPEEPTRGGSPLTLAAEGECPPRPEGVCVIPRNLVETALASPDAGVRAMGEAIALGRATRPLLRRFEELADRGALDPAGRKDEKGDPPPPAAAIRPPAGLLPAIPANGSWVPLGPTNQPGRMTGIGLDTEVPSIVYATGADGGVWKSVDGGAKWAPMSDLLETTAAGAVAIDPLVPRNILLGTGEGNFSNDSIDGIGVYRSTNAGVTWVQSTFAGGLGGGPPDNVRRILFDPSNPTIAYLAGDGGFYRSTDSGVTWAKLKGGLPTGYSWGTDFVVHPTNGQTLWAAAGYYTGAGTNGIYKSTNGGTNWTKLSGGLPTVGGEIGRISLGICRSQPNVLYAGIQDWSTNPWGLRGLYRTSDGGTTWTQLPFFDYCTGSTGPQCWYNNVVAVDWLNANRVFVGGIDIHRSTDGGNSWTRISDGTLPIGSPGYVHHDIHDLQIPEPGTIWAASDGGVSKSTDGGNSWALLRGTGVVGESLETAQFYSVALHPTDPNVAVVGGQDVGTLRYDGTSSFGVLYGGDGIDGGRSLIDPVDSSVIFGEDVYLQIKRFTNGGTQVAPRRPVLDPDEGTRFLGPLVMDPQDHRRLYCGSQRIWRAEDNLQANSWVDISGYFAGWSAGQGPAVSAIAVAPSNPNRLYIGSTGGAGSTFSGFLYTTENAKTSTPPATWTSLQKSPLPSDRTLSDIAIHPTDERTLWISFRTDSTGGRVFRSTNAGGTWVAASTGIPNLPVNCLLLDPASPTSLLAGTEAGIWRSDDAGASWSNFGQSRGLPNVRVDDLEYNPTTRVLRAATHGRGLWEFVGIPPTPKEAASDGSLRAFETVDGRTTISFAAACGATNHALYRGKLPITDDVQWKPQSCAIGPSGPVTVDLGSANAYFVVVGGSELVSREGSYGRDSSGTERRGALDACWAQDLTGSCP